MLVGGRPPVYVVKGLRRLLRSDRSKGNKRKQKMRSARDIRVGVHENRSVRRRNLVSGGTTAVYIGMS